MINITRVISTLVGGCTLYFLSTHPNLYKIEDGSESAFTVFLPTLLGLIAGYLSTAFSFNNHTRRLKKHDQRVIGVIKDIYTTRTDSNLRPIYRVLIKYRGLEKVFGRFNYDIGQELNIGDKAIVYCSKKKFEDAFFDIKETIESNISKQPR